MANTTKKVMREGFDRLKKTLEKLIKPNKKSALPQLALQPVRNQPDVWQGKKYLRGTDLHCYCAGLRSIQ